MHDTLIANTSREAAMRTLATFSAALMLAAGVAWAQIAGVDSAGTGTITGVVIDGETKEPLPGAVILVEGTSCGANADIEGKFSIVNVPFGRYDIKARMMGFKVNELRNVRVTKEAIVSLVFKLEPTVFVCTPVYFPTLQERLKETNKVYATYNNTTLMSLPYSTYEDLLPILPGNIVESKTARHISEAVFLIDKYDVTDRQYGNFPAIITPSFTSYITVNTTGMQPSDGSALSSMVSIMPMVGVGGHKGITFATDGLHGNKNEGQAWWNGIYQGKAGSGNAIQYTLQCEVEKREGEGATSVNSRAFVVDPHADYLWADTLRYSQSIWVDTLGRWSGGWMDSADVAWAREKYIREREGLRRGWKEQETWRLPHTDMASINLSGAVKQRVYGYRIDIDLFGAYNKEQNSDYTASWKYNADQYYAHAGKSWLLGIKMTHQPTGKLFYNVAINKYRITKQTGVRDTTAERGRDWWEDYAFVPDIDLDGDNIYDGYEDNMYDYSSNDNPYGVPGIFVGRGMAGLWRKSMYEYTGFAGNIVWQADRINLFIAGVDLKTHQVYLRENSLPWYPYFYKDCYQKNPRTAGVYIQNRFEFEGFTVQPGLRWDYIDPQTLLKIDFFELSDFPATRPAKSRQCLSPRLGFSWPVSERAVYRANFGRYAQQPLFHHMYQNLDADWLSSTHVIGNPELKHQKATIYEAGFDRQTGPYTLSGSLYYKERIDLVGLAAFGSDWLGGDAIYYYQYQNNGQSTTRGLVLSLRKDCGISGLSGEASYTFQNTSYSLNPAAVMHRAQWFYDLGADPFTGFPMENYQEDHPPDWDMRHKIVLITNYQTGARGGPMVRGRWPFSNVNICLVNLVKSGLPYTRIGLDGTVRGGLNRGRLPWTWNTDLKIEKRLKVWKSEGSLALEILNLFDRRNISGVYPQTGSPDWMNPPLDRRAFGDSSIVDSLPGPVNAFGDTVFIPNADYNQRRDLNGDGEIDADEMYGTYLAAWEDFVSDPRNGLRTPNPSAYQPPRSIRLTLGVKF
jgi:hypothetical protein